MISVSDATWWDETVSNSHGVAFRFELKSFDNFLLRELVPISGVIQCAAQQAAQRTLSLRLFDDGTLIPTANNTLLSPMSDNEIHVYFTLTDGAISEEIKIGIFRIADLSINYDEDGILISLEGVDRSFVFTNSSYSAAIPIPALTPIANPVVGSAISILTDLIDANRNINLSVFYSGDLPTATTPSGGTKAFGLMGNGIWQDLNLMAESIGAQIFFSADGVLTISQTPLMDFIFPVQTFTTGDTVLSASRNYDSSDFCNSITYNGVSTSINPLRTLYEPEPADSPFAVATIGRRNVWADSLWVFSADQLLTAAIATYQFIRGYEIELSIVPNPRLEIFDVVKVVVSELQLNTVGIITGINVPLDADSPMKITVRVRGY